MGGVGIDEMNDVEAADATIAAVKQLSADVGIQMCIRDSIQAKNR